MARLTPRERELALLVREGLDNKELGARPLKSVYTVKKQLQSVFRKLEIPSRTRLIALLR